MHQTKDIWCISQGRTPGHRSFPLSQPSCRQSLRASVACSRRRRRRRDSVNSVSCSSPPSPLPWRSICCMLSPPPPCGCRLFAPPPPLQCVCFMFSAELLAAAATAQCLLHALAAAAAWLLLVRAAAAAAEGLFHVLAAETPAEGSHRQHRRRMGECTWLAPDAADATATAEGGSTATTIDKGVPPLSTRACNMLTAACPPAGGQTAVSRCHCLLRHWGGVEVPHTPSHTPPCPPPHLPLPYYLTCHPYHTATAIPPVAGAVPQGSLVTGFPPWGAPGAYIHATHALTSTLHTIHVPYTPPHHVR
jgi:hypothetical protein